MASDSFRSLGRFLTASEAEALAAQFETGAPMFKALEALNPARRDEVELLLEASGLAAATSDRGPVLWAIAGAKSVHRDLVPVWTMPGNEASIGHLTGEFDRVVRNARQSVVCATYNFEPTSQMWSVLRDAAANPGVAVTVYVDGSKANAAEVKAHLGRANVYRSATLSDGKQIVSHAKFVSVDHELLLLTSANFSFSAENKNIEFGLSVHDSGLAESVEAVMASKCGVLYELV